MLSRGFSTDGTTDYIVPGMGAIPVANGKQDTPHWGNSFTAQVSQVVYAGGAIRSGIRMAELGKEMAELDVEKNRQEVRFLLTGYYLDLYKLGNQIEVVRQNIALTQKEIDQMKARREQVLFCRTTSLAMNSSCRVLNSHWQSSPMPLPSSTINWLQRFIYRSRRL